MMEEKEVLSYIKCLTEVKQEAARLDIMKEKFKDRDLVTILDTLLIGGLIYEPEHGSYKYLG